MTSTEQAFEPPSEVTDQATEQTLAPAFGIFSGWGLIARQVEIEAIESFDGTRSNDKSIVNFSKVDPGETFRL